MVQFVVGSISDTYVEKAIIPEDRSIFQSPLYLIVVRIWFPDVAIETSCQPSHRFRTSKFPDGGRKVGEDLSQNDVEQGDGRENNSRSNRPSH
jgi:hypothetical protein